MLVQTSVYGVVHKAPKDHCGGEEQRVEDVGREGDSCQGGARG